MFKSLLFWLAGEVTWLAVEVLSPCQNKSKDFLSKVSLFLQNLDFSSLINQENQVQIFPSYFIALY